MASAMSLLLMLTATSLLRRAVLTRSCECVGMRVIFSRGTGGVSEHEVEKINHLSNGDSQSIRHGIMIGLRGW